MTDTARQKDVRESNLHDPQVEEHGYVRRAGGVYRERHWQRTDEGENVTHGGGGESGGAGAVASEPSQAGEHERVGQAADERDGIAAARVGRSREGGLGSDEEERDSGEHG